MQLSSQLDFAADPATVAAMLTNRDFLERVCAASDAIEHSVKASADRTKVTRTLTAPASVAKFTGDKVTIVEAVEWGEADFDGSRTGTLNLTIPGLPVAMTGTAALRRGGRGTTVAYDADLKVNIPFVGKKLEESAAPAVLAWIELQQRVGDDWLADKS
ncbi:MAG TPA: DUF2505 domain-containing protein [Propionibacteriaceae bacterium]|nr:DUF2505 domain-containing protein [Propionibacteriaceae bacterium]